MEPVEEWRDIAGYEGYYQVSNLGRVKGLPRKKYGRSGSFFWLKETIKNAYPQADGYLQIGLSKDGTKTNYLLHRLVGVAFIPGDTSLEINHIDFDRTNCRVDNLEWETRQGNVEHSYVNGRYNFKEERGITKLTSDIVRKIRREGETERSVVLAQRYGVTNVTINAVKRRAIWAHVA